VKLCQAMHEVHDPHPPEEWEAFLCMIRPQGGTLHIAPIRLPWKKHTHRTWIMVSIEHVESRYDELLDPDVDVAGFEAEHEKLMQQAFDALTQAASSPEAKAALEQLHARHPYTRIGIHYDDKETMFDMKIPDKTRRFSLPHLRITFKNALLKS
jgi:hypothetical protein